MGPFVKTVHSISNFMTERQAYIAFNLTENVGVATLGKLMAKFGSAVQAWEAYPNKVARSGGEVDWCREEALAERYGVKILTLVDEAYPKRLKDSPGVPLVLYVKGDVAALSTPMVAMIGTRRATTYGQSVARNLSSSLARAGWTIVSGLATGIDAASHHGALEGEGVTIGVLGSGLDRFFPEENRELAHEMVAKKGAVVSQFPFGRSADQSTFPIRNHVVAALARGVVAVECPARSGTLITTGIALDMGRPVMAVPGRIDSRMSAGCLQLLRDGATLVRNADDVLEVMNEGVSVKAEESEDELKEEPAENPRFSVEEALLVSNLDEEGVTSDELVRRTHLPIRKVNSLAMELRLKGVVRFLPGNRISLLTQSP